MRKRSLLDIDAGNDISYTPPLSYRHFRIFGWSMLICVQLSLVFASIAGFNAHGAGVSPSDPLKIWSDALAFFGQLAIPFFLLANFALILSSQERIGRLIATHASLAVVVYAAYLLGYDRYVIAFANRIFSIFHISDSKPLVDTFVQLYFTRYFSLNIFVDLLMCSSLYFFLVHKPKRVKKEHLVYFRMLVVLPIAYEFGSMAIKGLSLGMKLFTLPVDVLPLLTSKSIVTFLAFLVIVIYLKNKERIYVKLGGTPERYHGFLLTKAHVFQVSVAIAIIFGCAGIIDIILSSLISLFMAIARAETSTELLPLWNDSYGMIQSWGLGKGASLLVISPLILLFNYRKKYSLSSKNVDYIIPFTGLAACAIVLLEGAYQLTLL